MGGYFKAQFKIMGVVALILLVGFAILRIRYAVLFAVLIAVLDFLPFFGTGTVLIPWAVLKVFSADYEFAVGLIIIYLVSQLVRQLIQPKIVGDTIGLNPLATLFCMFIGYKVGGIIAMIIAVAHRHDSDQSLRFRRLRRPDRGCEDAGGGAERLPETGLEN